ncbi:MAG: quinate 5-dehydrogenase [Firmicutes bacterium]|nr:quinate 5-dehydrogenase [Bacillota bacterium]
MKHVVGISLGSEARNHSVIIKPMGIECKVERIATNGDLKAMISYIKENDGKVDAFGLGGMDLYLHAIDRRYEIRDARKVVEAAKQTPIVDGSGLKNTLERRVIKLLSARTDIFKNNPRVLLMSAMDRLGMAQSLEEAGCRMIYGDFPFALKLPIPMYNLKQVALAARTLLPILSVLPFKIIYPTGKNQDENKPSFVKYFEEADIVAGDFHFMKRNMPLELPGKTIITNTVTMDDVKFLEERKVKRLITTTPEFEGRSFGTNVIEALLICLSGNKRELTPEEYHEMLGILNLEPRIVELN